MVEHWETCIAEDVFIEPERRTASSTENVVNDIYMLFPR
jgi:hypothetical protein